MGETTLVAKAGELTDEGTIRKVDVFNEDNRLNEQGAVLNWFDIVEKEGYFSLNDKIGDIMATFMGKIWLGTLMLGMKKKMDANKKPAADGEKKKEGGFKINMSALSGMGQMMSGFTVLRMTGMLGMVGVSYTKEELLALNEQLSKIKKPKK